MIRDEHSTSIYENNKQLLEQFFPQVAEFISSEIPSNPLTDEDDIHPLYSSPNSFPRYFIVLGNAPSFVISLLQEHLDQLYRIVWVVPNSQALAQSLHHSSLSQVLKDTRTRIVMVDDLQPLHTVLSEDITGIGIWGVNVFGSQTHEPSHEVMKMIHQIEAVAHENATIQYHQGPEVQKNIVANLSSILNATVLDQWKDQYSQQPAVVVGAGPSLDHNLHVLEKTQNKPLIICVDTALKILMQRGIEPDFVVSCDPTTLNTRHFKGVQLPQKTVFAFLPEIHRSVLPMLAHSQLLCLHDTNSKLLDCIMQPLALQTTFSRGMNVGFCAYSLAKVLGCSPIILIGMDLALEAGQSSHAQGTANASTVEIDETKGTVQLTGNVQTNKSQLVETAGYHGGTVTTFQHFHLVLQRFAQDIATHNVPVINATEGGAQISGTSQLSLSQALSHTNNTPKLNVDIPHSQINPALMQETLTHLKRYLKELDHTRQNLERGAYRIQQWLHEMQSKQNDIQTVQSQAESLLKRWQDILDHIILDECLDIGLAPMRFDTYRIDPPQLDNPNELAQWWHDWLLAHFQAMQAETETYIQLFGGTVQKLIAIQHKNF